MATRREDETDAVRRTDFARDKPRRLATLARMETRPAPVLVTLSRAGAVLFGAAFVAFAVQNFTQTGYVIGLEPLPKFLPGRPVWEVLNSLILLGAGGWIVVRRLQRKSATVPALVLGVLLFLWIVLLHVRVLIIDHANGARWGVLCETFALAFGAWMLAGIDAAPGRWPVWSIRVGRIGYGVTLLGFAAFHVVFAAYIISVVPAWLPWHAFWCYFTCAAFVAGAVSIFSGVLAAWGAFWTGVMLLSWVVMLHGPRVVQAARAVPYNADGYRDELSSLVVALGIGAAAWVVAQSFLQTRAAEPTPL